jgi:hypothetical protein
MLCHPHCSEYIVGPLRLVIQTPLSHLLSAASVYLRSCHHSEASLPTMCMGTNTSVEHTKDNTHKGTYMHGVTYTHRSGIYAQGDIYTWSDKYLGRAYTRTNMRGGDTYTYIQGWDTYTGGCMHTRGHTHAWGCTHARGQMHAQGEMQSRGCMQAWGQMYVQGRTHGDALTGMHTWGHMHT